MRRFYLLVIFGYAFAFTAELSARTWTNAEGREITADYISSEGENVLLKIKGKEVSYPLEKLSEADREWVAEQVADGGGKAAGGAATGLRKGVPLTERLFPDLKGYTKDRTRKSVAKAFENGAYSSDQLRHDDEEGWMKRDAEKDRYDIYVPASYDGSAAYGLYLHISPSDGGGIPSDWLPVFDEHKLIAVTAHGTSNDQQMMRRVTLSVDAMHAVKQDYQIEQSRSVVGGLSGGGHMAMLTAAMFPEFFVGAISHAAQSYLPSGPQGSGHFPGMEIQDFKRSPRKAIHWVVISGDKDQNYKEIQKTSEVWADERLTYRFIDVPGMGHTNAKSEDLAKAFDWIFE